MGMQLWLAAVLRAAGLTVVEEPGWRTRSAAEDPAASSFRPVGLIAHHTGGSLASTVAGEVRTLINGRPGLTGPISQLFLARSGVWHVVAAGLCHHAKIGWGGLLAGHGNTTLIGVEAQHSGGSEPWTPVQYQSYVAGVAAICQHMRWDPQRRVAGHREHQPGDKPDPTFDLATFRRDVAAAMDGDDMITADALLAALQDRRVQRAVAVAVHSYKGTRNGEPVDVDAYNLLTGMGTPTLEERIRTVVREELITALATSPVTGTAAILGRIDQLTAQLGAAARAEADALAAER